MKYFISQPMTGIEKEEVERVREEVKEYIESIGGEAIYSYEENNNAVWCLGKALEKMSEADVVYIVDGWKESKGCKIEHLCAKLYGMKVVYEKPEFVRDLEIMCGPYEDAWIRG